MKTKLILLFSLLFIVPALFAEDDVVLKAMKDEMARSKADLRLPELDKPYFISYRMLDTNDTWIGATLGSLTRSTSDKSRLLSVDVRVGDYALDNTNFVSSRQMAYRMASLMSGTRQVTVDDDYGQLRRALWLTTDSEYKKSAEELAAKKSVLQHRKDTSDLSDFTKQEAVEVSEPGNELNVDVKRLESLAKKLSSVFSTSPEIFSSSVTISCRDRLLRYVNSEGSIVTKRQPLVQLIVQASTQATDGVPLSDVLYLTGHSIESVTSQAPEKRVQELAARLVALRSVNRDERYNGPVLFEGQAAGQLIAQVFAPAIVAARIPLSDTPQFETGLRQFMSQIGGGTLADRLGARVLPEWIDITDKPLETQAAGATLLGSSVVDDEAVKTHDVNIVEHGILKAMLSTRTPSQEAKTTTGSAHLIGAAPTNLFVTTRKNLSKAELRKELLRLAKDRGLDYGIIVRDVGLAGLSWVRRMGADPTGSGGFGTLQMFKLYPDGREEPVRDLDFTTFNVTALKEFVAAGDDVTVNHSPFIPMMAVLTLAGGGSSPGGTEHLISSVTPSLLLDDVTLKRGSGAGSNPPVVESPLLASKAGGQAN